MGRIERSLPQWLKYQQSLHPKEIDLGLSRIQKVYKKLLPKGVTFKIITVAGTNGKGSTLAFLENIYAQAGYKVGKFTSPHLFTYNERVRLNLKNSDDDLLCLAFSQIEQVRGNTSLSFFEFSALAGLWIFAQQKVDVALLEIGIGGRMDAVNVVDSDVALITNIALEHTDYLGNTRALIGAEKAGIMRKNTPCICADNNPPKSIQQRASAIGAKLSFVDHPYLGEIGLLGVHQRRNVALAIQAVRHLQATFPISKTQLKFAIKNTTLDARLQIRKAANKTLIFDVAHNPAAVQVLTDELTREKIPTLAIFSTLKDKNINLMIKAIRPIISQWLLVPLDNPRAMSMASLNNQFTLSDNILACKDGQQALELALKDSHSTRIVAFGSFYLVADIIKAFDKRDCL